MRAMIDRKLKLMETEGSDSSDLLELLLQFTRAKDDKNYRITIEDVSEECKLFYFAGQETMSTLLTWTLLLLPRHPDWQQRARDEILRTCGKHAPDIESTNQLKIVSINTSKVLI